MKTSRSRIKRLWGVSSPQYRLRVGDIRVFYDVDGEAVTILAVVRKSEAEGWLGPIRKSTMKEVPLSEARDDLSHLLREAEKRDIVITRRGKPAGVLIGFASEDEWFEYRLEHDPRFLSRIAKSRESARTGRVVKLQELDEDAR